MTKKEEKNIGITVKKSDDFSEWYTQAVTKSDLADYTSVSGCIALKPYSYEIWEKIKEVVDSKLKKLGVKNCYFPMFIPESLLQKEADHVEGFSPEVAWVTHGGDTKLGERLAVRPTSEAIMYDSYSKWIRSWRDLPLKLNQWNNVVRWEFKHPVVLLRTREFLWNEGHTAFATKEEAEKEIEQVMALYQDVCENYLALYGISGKKTESEKFAGAVYTKSIEYLLPSGKGVQGPDAHHDGQNFAKAYQIQFLDREEKKNYVWQNTWAITTRMIGVMIAVHGDDKGLVLPPRLAPIQAVIVPIYTASKKAEVMKAVDSAAKSLKKFSLEVDDRDYSPGWKFNEWEMKGVPVRIEIGPRDVEKNQAVIVRRDNGKKEFVPLKSLAAGVESTLEEIQKSLLAKSRKFLQDNIAEASAMKQLVDSIKAGKMARVFFCGNLKCEEEIKDKTGGATARCIPSDAKKGKCVLCGKEGQTTYFAKAY
ncbi:proline--tRNA ligase [Candidatus Woesearchaeota archaeon]|nr:proline--tRNA ligase [Candidatus Woesearchaeota archaeon]